MDEVKPLQGPNKTAWPTGHTGREERNMKFTFEEWKFIQHCLECASREFERQMQDCKVSDEELSSYQIFKRQTEKANYLVNKLKNAEI